MDLNFEQLLAQHNQEFKDAEVFDNWMPPVGDYIISIIKFKSGQGSKKDLNLLWWKLTCRIEDVQNVELNGKEFTVYYSTKAYGIFKGAARVLSGNSTLNEIPEAHEVFEKSPGTVAKVEIVISTSKKDGKDYKNCYFREVIDTTTTTSAETVEAPVAVAPGDNPNIPTEADLPGIPAEVPAEAPPVV